MQYEHTTENENGMASNDHLSQLYNIINESLENKKKKMKILKNISKSRLFEK